MTELIKVTTNQNNEQVVSARNLYQELGIKKRFSEWWSTNSKGFVDGVDYTPYLEVHPQNKQEIQNYAMILDMAKHLAIQTQSARGFEVRTYFIEVEKQYKNQLDTSSLSPELQFMNSVVNQLANQELATKQLESKVDGITEIVGVSSTNWREDSNKLVNKIVRVHGGSPDSHREVRAMIFEEVDKRGGVSLQTRLTNKRRRMADEGVSKSRRDRLTKIDVIADDKKLIEIYVAVVKEYAIKYGVWK